MAGEGWGCLSFAGWVCLRVGCIEDFRRALWILRDQLELRTIAGVRKNDYDNGTTYTMIMATLTLLRLGGCKGPAGRTSRHRAGLTLPVPPTSSRFLLLPSVRTTAC